MTETPMAEGDCDCPYFLELLSQNRRLREASRAPQAGGEGLLIEALGHIRKLVMDNADAIRKGHDGCQKLTRIVIEMDGTALEALRDYKRQPTPADEPKGDAKEWCGLCCKWILAKTAALSTPSQDEGEALDGVHAVGYREGFMTAEALRRADREALRRALEPFARLAEFVDEDSLPDDYPVHVVRQTTGEVYRAVAGDYRRAREALSRSPEDDFTADAWGEKL